jgi:hypothetical protein
MFAISNICRHEQLFLVAPLGNRSEMLKYGFATGVFGCNATGINDEDLGAKIICPDAPITSNGPVVDWLAPQVAA